MLATTAMHEYIRNEGWDGGGAISQHARPLEVFRFSMDPVSLTASLLAISGAVGQIFKAVRSVHRGLTNADGDVTEAADQLAIIRHQLEQLRKFKEAIESDKQCGKRAAFDTSLLADIVKACNALIVDVYAAFPKETKHSPIRKRLQWAFRDREVVQRLVGRLHIAWGLLNTSLQLNRAELDRTLEPTLVDMRAKQNEMHTDIQLLTLELERRTLLDKPERHHTGPIPLHELLSPPPLGQQQIRQKNGRTFMNKWLPTPQLILLYCRSTGQRRRQLLFLGAVLPRSKVFLVRWSGFSYGIGMNLSIRFQNIIPMESTFVQACKKGDVMLVKGFLESGNAMANDITDSNETPLMFAIDSRSSELVKVLLFSGADSNMSFGRWQTSPLQVAFETGQPEIARQLLRHGADIDYLSARGWSVLSYLWENGDAICDTYEFYEICSAQSFNAFDAQDRRGWSCLHRAAAYGTPQDIDHLLNMGASMSLCTRGEAWTPIHVASALNNEKTLHEFARRVSSGLLHSPDANGWTPLHIAVERGAEDTMRYLLKAGANPHARSYVTAEWFPAGLEHRVLTPEDLAHDRGGDYIDKYYAALLDAHFDVSISDDDIFWDAENSEDEATLVDEN